LQNGEWNGSWPQLPHNGWTGAGPSVPTARVASTQLMLGRRIFLCAWHPQSSPLPVPHGPTSDSFHTEWLPDQHHQAGPTRKSNQTSTRTTIGTIGNPVTAVCCFPGQQLSSSRPPGVILLVMHIQLHVGTLQHHMALYYHLHAHSSSGHGAVCVPSLKFCRQTSFDRQRWSFPQRVPA
jgi:hypothetical protein